MEYFISLSFSSFHLFFLFSLHGGEREFKECPMKVVQWWTLKMEAVCSSETSVDSTDYTALYPRRRYSSLNLFFFLPILDTVIAL
jgi:hypothetical protein